MLIQFFNDKRNFSIAGLRLWIANLLDSRLCGNDRLDVETSFPRRRLCRNAFRGESREIFELQVSIGYRFLASLEMTNSALIAIMTQPRRRESMINAAVY
jgi:hypothetical protein